MPNKAQFVDQLAERLDGDRKRAAAALDAVIDNVYAAISRGERVAITGFGVFERRERAARTGRNPATGESVQVPASRVPAFRPGAEFKNAARGARDVLEDRSERTQALVASAFASARALPGRAAGAVRDSVTSATRTPAAKSASKSAAKKSTAKKSSPAKKSTAKKSSPAKKSTAKKSSPAKKSTAKKSTAKKSSPAKKSTAKKSTAKKSSPAKKSTAKKSAEKAPAKKR